MAIHARKDYNRFQDPALEDPSLLGEGSTPIAEDEPVFLFRAKDTLFMDVLIHYRDKLYGIGAAQEMLDTIDTHIARARVWRRYHETKTPDIPVGSGVPLIMCDCGGGGDSVHVLGQGGCYRELVPRALEPVHLTGNFWEYGSEYRVPGECGVVTYTTLHDQRGYAWHKDTGRWSRTKDHKSRNSLEA